MALGRWQRTITDAAGNALAGAQVTVRRETAGSPLAVLYSDRDGTLADVGNPFNADADGFAAFYASGGAFRIDVSSGSFSATWRYVPIGLAAEGDSFTPGVGLLWSTDVNDSDPGAGFVKCNNSTPALATQLFVSNDDVGGNDVTAWLATLDDGGGSSDRGALVLRSADGLVALVARVTGTVTAAAGYYKVPVTVLTASAAASFTDDLALGAMFGARGTDGQVSSTGSFTLGNLARFADSSGDVIEDSGKSVTTVGAGKQTVWMPAAAMTPRTTNGAASGTVETTTNKVMLGTLDFDTTTQEFAQFSIRMPKGWNESTVTFQAVWSHAATATNFGVAWALQAFAFSDDDAADQAFGTEQVVTDTGGTTNDIYITAESSAITVGGTPAEGDWVVFQVKRVPSNGSDTMAIDARLHGISLFYTTNANTDA